uniref:RING-type domain-containing protein n=1 Tax=Panagrellus redivivus TaxID=6233 RepID=A0A7E4W6Q2_PANRE
MTDSYISKNSETPPQDPTTNSESKPQLLPLTHCRCCQKPMTDNLPSACTYPCGHSFHSICMEKLKTWPSLCPKCFTPIPGLEDDDEDDIPGSGCQIHELPHKAPKRLKKCCMCKKRIFTLPLPTSQSTCGHLFHLACMEKLIKSNTECPVCHVSLEIAGNGLRLVESLRSPMFEPKVEPILEILDE